MASVDVESFIKCQRAKLADEKMKMNRPANGILPTDSVSLEKRRLLRQERQSEYLDFINKRDRGRGNISRLRSELSQDREAELSRSHAALKDSKAKEPAKSEREGARSDYAAIRAKAFAQEKQYSSGSLGHLDHGRKSRGAISSGKELESTLSERQVDFSTPQFQKDPQSQHAEPNGTIGQRKAWDDEEKDLMQWTKDKANRGRLRNRPESRSEETPVESVRVPPLPGWGKSYTDEQKEQRLKQQQYAEELQRQMKEKYPSSRRTLEAGTERSRGANSRQRSSLRRTVGSQSRDRSTNNDTGRGALSKDELSNNSSKENLPHDYSSYPAQFPMYPYPAVPPGYQMPSGGPWPPPPFVYPPYSDYRHGQQHPEVRPPPMYYQPYYFSPPDNLPKTHSYGPVPSLPYPYNRPPHADSREPLQSYSRHVRDPLPDHRGRRVERDSSPPNSFRGRSEKSHSFETGSDTSPAQEKLEYRRQLQEQVREKKRRELEEKMAREREEDKKATDIYDPFGKGGCGAPVRDQHGNLVADLKQMRKINENRLSNNSVKVRPSSVLRSESKGSTRPEVPSDSPVKSSQQETILTYNNRETEGTRRNAQDSYRDYLQQQVLEKERLKKEEKEKQRLEELKQLEQLEKERKKMQEEYQQEQEKQRKKEEDLRKKNEAIKLEAEKERQRVIMQRQKEAQQDEEERRKVAAQELEMKMVSPRAPAVQYQRATWSPPIPTLRHQMKLGKHGPVPPAETAIESSRHLLHTQNHVRRSNRPYVGTSSSEDATARLTPAFRHEPRRTTSPPVPAVRKKLTRSDHVIADDSPDDLLATAVADTTAVDRRDTRPPRLELLRQTEEPGTSQRSLGRDLSQGSNKEILTKLGALRMYLQEELAKQQSDSETNSEIFERVKQQRPRLAVPKRPKATNNTMIRTNAATNRHVPSGDAISAVSVPRGDPPDQISVNSSVLTDFTYRGLPKETYSNSTLPSSLLSKKNNTAESQRPYQNTNLAHPTYRVGEPSTRRGGQTSNPVQMYREGRAVSPSITSVNTEVIDTMAERTAERMRRLDAIINSTDYGEPSLDGRSIDTSSIVASRQEGGRLGEGTGLRPGQTQRLYGGHQDLRRRSEHSLNSDTRHLPIN